MLKNYFKIALRSLRAKKASTIITASGLIMGVTAFVFILQYVAFEFSVNKFHKNEQQIYRVVALNELNEAAVMLPPGIANAIINNVSGVEYATRFPNGICSGVVTINEGADSDPRSFTERGCKYADQSIFDIFTFETLHGTTSLSDPKTTVFTASQARKYFNRTDVVGEKINLSNQFGSTEYTITGVIKDVSNLSDFDYSMLLSFNTLENPANTNGNDWVNPKGLDNGFTMNFVMLNKSANPDVVAQSFNTYKKSIKPNDESVIKLQRLKDVHLAPSFSYSLPTYGSLTQVILILSIGILIMIIAWANYINLSTAQGLDRAKQVGIQQTIGASRLQLSTQFLIETFIFLLIGLGLAIVMVELLQPYFNELTGKLLDLSILNNSLIWISGMLFLLFGTITAGGYVAFILTSQNPKDILKGSKGNEGKGLAVRKALVVFQFAISIALIVTTLVFQSQLDFMLNRDLGMSLDNRLVIKGPSVRSENTIARTSAFKEQLATLSFVDSYAGSNNVPGNGFNFNASGITGQDPKPDDEKKSFGMLIIDDRYFDTYEIEFASGKNYSNNEIELGWNTNELVINEKAAKELGYESASEALEKQLFWGTNSYKISGVVKDYHHSSLQELIKPMIFLPQKADAYFTIRLSNENYSSSLSQLKRAYADFFPGNPFEYFFIEDEYDTQYSAEKRFRNLFIVASFLAIIIACLGLFGLAAFIASSRTKEIGVRKVLGASVLDIISLLTKDFAKLVLLGFLIAAPISWFAMKEWLKNFAYSTELGVEIFILSGFTALLIAVIAVGGRAYSAATNNPINSLKND
jgi:putative ABC transport system permease protein